jgi:AraC family transcriptional regulator of adaptative response/methylated-DNA-[protein]-cysteine methyltransferase
LPTDAGEQSRTNDIRPKQAITKSEAIMSDTKIDAARDDAGRWSAVEQRDRSAEMLFVYAVKTTGIYCRPGCSSRLPRRENVAFFDTPLQARGAGFRPCKRCRPDTAQSQVERVDAVQIACKLIDEAEEPPSLEELASAVNYSPSYFQRLFKQTVGVTPKAYAAMRRANRIRENLLCKTGVAQAVYSSGYGTSSRFYEESSEVLGMKPSQYRGGAKGITIRVAVAATTLGQMLVAATDKGLCAIEFGDDDTEMLSRLRKRFPDAELNESDSFQGWVEDVVAYVDSSTGRLSLPLDIQGTAFQRRVWEELRKVPSGSTTTYAELANQIGQPTAARAVAGACAANRLAVAIPCHRVVRSDGNMGEYRWGIERKEALLERESKKSSELQP